MKLWPAAVVVAQMACTGKTETPPPPAPTVVIIDAGVDGITSIGTYDPASGAHLDEDGSAKPPARPDKNRPSTPIDITLRSSPAGARVAVDGVPVGVTPTFWSGEANGREHDFTFALPGYAVSRYRFVPVTSGVVHAKLDPVIGDADAGVSPEPPLAPPQYPSRHTAPADAGVSIDATASGDASSSGLGPAD